MDVALLEQHPQYQHHDKQQLFCLARQEKYF
jgi:hypothetical protein